MICCYLNLHQGSFMSLKLNIWMQCPLGPLLQGASGSIKTVGVHPSVVPTKNRDLWGEYFHLFMSTVVTSNVTPFNHSTMNRRCEKGQLPMLWPSLPAWDTETRKNTGDNHLLHPNFMSLNVFFSPKHKQSQFTEGQAQESRKKHTLIK